MLTREQTLTGHEGGVLSLSWCKQDVDLLLSSGKDNRTICWDPQTGEKLGEFPVVANWTYQTRWNPINPSLLATASFDGKVAVHTLQTCKANSNRPDASTANLDGEDFFTQATVDPQGPSFSLKKTPKWLEVPMGASFGFGGKLVVFETTDTQPGQAKRSKVTISKFEVETGISEATVAFEEALKKDSLSIIAESRANEANSESEKNVWNLLRCLVDQNSRARLRENLGFGKQVDQETIREEVKGVSTDSFGETGEASSSENKQFSSFFSDSNADSEFLSDLASIPSTRGTRTNNPFHIFSGSETESDKLITHAILLGQFEKAVDICLKGDRITDAFMLALCGGDKCTEKVRTAYLTKKAKGPNYLRVLASVIGKNMWDVVYNADLANWKEAMVTLMSFASEQEFEDLCEVLGDRLLEEYQSNSGNLDLRAAAAFCYISGAKLDKVVRIWVEELHENEAAELQNPSGSSSFSIHVRSLQGFIEKVTVFRKAIKFEDKELGLAGNWKLATLYEKYCEYADVVAAHGYLDVAEQYLNLLPPDYPAAAISRNRVREATKKATSAQARKTQQPMKQTPTTASNAQYQPTRTAYQSPASAAPPTNLYASQGPTVTNTYAPQTQQAYGSNPYQPANVFQPSQTTYGSSNQPYAAPHTYGQTPQRTFTPPVSNAIPASKQPHLPNWNDTPIVANLSRRGTPAGTQAPITSPFPGAAVPSPPQAVTPFGAPPPFTGRAPPPPPPKNAAPPQRVTTPTQHVAQSPTTLQSGPPPSHPGYPQSQYGPPPVVTTSYGPPATVSRYAANAPSTNPPPPGRQPIAPPLSQAQTQYASRPPIGPPPMAGQNYTTTTVPTASPYAPLPAATTPSSSPYATTQTAPVANYGLPPGGIQNPTPGIRSSELSPPPQAETSAPPPPAKYREYSDCPLKKNRGLIKHSPR